MLCNLFQNVVENDITKNIFGDKTYFITHVLLVSLYFLFLIYSLYTYLKEKERFRRITIATYWPLLLGNVFRIVSFSLFILYKEEILPKSKYLGNLLFGFYIVPALLFLTFFLSISLLLLKIYKRVKSNNKEVTQYKTTIKMLNLIIYTVMLIMVILEFTLSPNEKASVDIPDSPAQVIIQMFIAFIYLFASSVSIINIILLYNNQSINYDGGFDANATTEFKKKYYKIAFIGCCCFLARSIITTITVFNPIDPLGIKDIIYYPVLEIIPILLLLNITNGLHQYAGTLGEINERTGLLKKN
ncbi:hypothetical protein ACTFIR_003205 [Dictyostelium discoideum]